MPHLLVVDDEQSICWAISKLGQELGCTVNAAASAEQGLASAEMQKPDAVVLDVRLPGMDGLTAMNEFKRRIGSTPIIIITAFGDLATAVEAVRRGAFEYLIKPFELKVARRAIERALERPAPVQRAETESTGAAQFDPQEIVGSSPAIQEVFKRIAMAAPSETCVHLHGESGVGKELVARAIHRYSRRANGPFVAVNVAALSPSLAESELFGHVRGAFTGADQSRKGLLEQADGGTIFFDEVADIPLPIQIKLLRALEYGEILPVGGSKPLRSDFRVLSATHQNLSRLVVEGTFRQDLYFRLITFAIEIPPLRERKSDIDELTERFLTTLSAKNECPRPTLAPETIVELERRPWHGNVRELRNALEHAIILARGGFLLPEHLPSPNASPDDASETREGMLAEMVRDWTNRNLELNPEADDVYQRLLNLVEPPLFETVLEKHRGQFASAARQLGIHRVTLKRKIDEINKKP